MGKILDGLRRAVYGKLTDQQAIPKTTKGQAAALLRDEKKTRGEAGAVQRAAARLGIHPDSFRRYLNGKRKNPPAQIQQKLDSEVRANWKPRLQKQVIKAAQAGPVRVKGKAEFGYSNSRSGATTPDPRMRHIAETLPPQYATPLFQALEDGDEQEAQRILALYIQVEKIHEAGGDNEYTEIQFGDIRFMDFDI
ncbi:telomere-protecting terminal protein Tpg [Streptomyces roseus]|uniref:Terminal protein TpgA2 n=1 Tax=Streptomyces roseus TaxID=66430 RepID=A0A0J6XFB1_9ACTN|nr:hypothetical protein [Streptomyces roseus]KMO93804.1 hypothetical protein ACS04_33060 [Streptomyces roseus]